MTIYWKTFTHSFIDYGRYLVGEIVRPHSHNYFYWLIGFSLVVYVWELLRPWRPEQPRIRRDFWLDAFYMFFNFFLFNLIAWQGVSNVAVLAFSDALEWCGITNLVAIEVGGLPTWLQLAILFLLRDFIQYNIHRLLHRVPWLWSFHKVHHSVAQMGFAARLRFHWLETAAYRTLEYIPLAIIGFGIDDFLIVHLASLLIGHLNHANIYLPLGPLRYVLNNPQMHIWHHVWHLPAGRRFGINYGLSLSLWDYLFGTACIPQSGRDIQLGFDDLESFPADFMGQLVHPFRRHS